MRAPPRDPFQRMLLWSFVVHALTFTSVALGARLFPGGNLLPEPQVGMFVSLGESGPGVGLGGGSPAPKPPEPEEPEPEPKREPEVVRPTVEQRDELPMPDAPVKRKPRFEKPKQDSGLRGADAASAESADLAGTGTPGIGLGGTGGGGGFDQDFEYSYYAVQMIQRVQRHWQPQRVSATAIVVISFTILKNGTVENVEVEQSSGVRLLDRGAMRAVMLADPMPPLPNSYPRDRVGVHLRFTYSES